MCGIICPHKVTKIPLITSIIFRGDYPLVDGQVEAFITRRRLDTSRSDHDVTIIYELQSCELKGIPLEDWRIDWERSQFPVDPMERMIEKRLIEALSADD